ncbi:hypothetical protein evm_001596 [Chilo suppressalis]|nr:hypothetical protein evm_001596 [Chilo suppressalis]
MCSQVPINSNALIYKLFKDDTSNHLRKPLCVNFEFVKKTQGKGKESGVSDSAVHSLQMELEEIGEHDGLFRP